MHKVILTSEGTGRPMFYVDAGTHYVALQPSAGYMGFKVGDILLSPREALELSYALRVAAGEVTE